MSSSLVIEIGCSSDGWAGALPDAEALLRRAANAAWEATGSGNAELSILLSGDAEIQALNNDYRGENKPTNVLSFPADDEGAAGRPRLLGDVVLALETIKREAATQAKPLADHLSHLTVHGVLHLLGHDHETETQATAMEALETEILSGLGVDDPYTAMDEPVG
ncbi:MAG: rRNA maturation RNase YbeY [Proteobacteria bacterium]|nr:rRNA maturation RNase YbeY [Pseudomonadota bacterium]